MNKSPKFRKREKVRGKKTGIEMEILEVKDASEAYPEYPFKYLCEYITPFKKVKSTYFEEHELEKISS